VRFTRVLLAADDNRVPAFAPHGEDADDVTFVMDDLVEHAKIPDAQFPRRHRP